ncbi:EpsG family protein [Paenibacillus sp. FJAT-27812]|uniref:EpsG family protein n=1 Tax=Paenibacillus sp. FJAT-27812 TaxID=1684143 RepID=UPI0006A7CBC3|nr:EpsG family protein [Paenibacillus sp. FJAT-27812]
MGMYIINLFFLLIWCLCYYVFPYRNKFEKVQDYSNNVILTKKDAFNNRRSIFIIIALIQMYLILALKNISVGTDTINYYLGFSIIRDLDWIEVFDLGRNNLVFNYERGFILLTKIISIFTDDFQVYYGVLYFIIMFLIYKFIKKYAIMPFLSIYLFISLGFYNFTFSGIRQAIAISVILFSYKYIINRKIVKFSICVIIAALFHKSAIIFLPAYFLYFFTITPIIAILYFVILIVLFIFRIEIFHLITPLVGYEESIETTNAYTLLIILLLTFTIGLFFYNKVIRKNENNKVIFNLIAIASLLMISTTISSVGLRAANYYYIFIILFIPNIISSFNNRSTRILAVLFSIILTIIFYILRGVYDLNGIPYKFYWQ